MLDYCPLQDSETILSFWNNAFRCKLVSFRGEYLLNPVWIDPTNVIYFDDDALLHKCFFPVCIFLRLTEPCPIFKQWFFSVFRILWRYLTHYWLSSNQIPNQPPNFPYWMNCSPIIQLCCTKPKGTLKQEKCWRNQNIQGPSCFPPSSSLTPSPLRLDCHRLNPAPRNSHRRNS